mmetsp:Transcript_48492/g.58711  ORF Transcript_48492/g.58711 Transcript_48492/m.58711 type:complete len:239 (-) Transcript_48492:149-865(-)
MRGLTHSLEVCLHYLFDKVIVVHFSAGRFVVPRKKSQLLHLRKLKPHELHGPLKLREIDPTTTIPIEILKSLPQLKRPRLGTLLELIPHHLLHLVNLIQPHGVVGLRVHHLALLVTVTLLRGRHGAAERGHFVGAFRVKPEHVLGERFFERYAVVTELDVGIVREAVLVLDRFGAGGRGFVVVGDGRMVFFFTGDVYFGYDDGVEFFVFFCKARRFCHRHCCFSMVDAMIMVGMRYDF